MTKFVCAVVGLLLMVFPIPAIALEASLASLQDGQVHVVGKGAIKQSTITWDGVPVATATPSGTFNFAVNSTPSGCVGELSDGASTIFIAVNGCVADGIESPPLLAAVPRTGQTQSRTAGDDGDLQAGLEWPTPRLTDNQDGTITDNLTGLIWLKDWTCSGAVQWADGFLFVSQLNTGTVPCGDTSGANGSHQTDWRVPNIREVLSLLDYGLAPALPADAPFVLAGAPPFASFVVWSSTYAVSATAVAAQYAVAIHTGASFPAFGAFVANVPAVRGGQVAD